MKEERVVYPDVIRTFACIFVIILHVSGSSSWYTLDVKENSWAVLMIYNALVRSAVPLFVMLSGMFLLNPSKQWGLKYLSRKIIHLLEIYIIWSVFYGIVWGIENFHVFQGQKMLDVLKSVCTYILESKFHLWFIPMLIGIYFVTPYLRKITESRKLTEYFLLLFFCFNIFRGSLTSVIRNDIVCSIINRIPMESIMGFSGYFVLGYYIAKWGIGEKTKILCRIVAVVAVLTSVFGSIYLSRADGIPRGMWTNEFSIASFLAAAAIFDVFKEYFYDKKCGGLVYFAKFTAKYSLGIYLIHVFWIEFLEKIGITVEIVSTIVSVPLLSSVIFGLSLLSCYLLGKIKIIQRMIF